MESLPDLGHSWGWSRNTLSHRHDGEEGGIGPFMLGRVFVLGLDMVPEGSWGFFFVLFLP